MDSVTLNLVSQSISFSANYTLALLFFGASNEKKSAKILGWFFTLAGTYFILNFLLNLEEIWQFVKPICSFLYLPVGLSLLPVMYSYVRRITGHTNDKKVFIYGHFIPSTIAFAVNGMLLLILKGSNWNSYFMQELNTPYDAGFSSLLKIYLYLFHEFMFAIQLVLYAVLMVIMLLRHKKQTKSLFSNMEKINLNWLLSLVLVFSVISIGVLCTEFGIKYHSTSYHFMMLFLPLLFCLYLGIFAFKQKEIYTDNEMNANTQSNNPVNGLRSYTTKYSNSSLADEAKQEIKSKLEALFNKDKPYLDDSFSLENLAKSIDVNKLYLSQVFSEVYGTNFYRYVNSYRVEEAKKLLVSSDYDNYTIEGIGKMVGYKSKSPFNGNFKNITGLTPSEFKRQLQNT